MALGDLVKFEDRRPGMWYKWDHDAYAMRESVPGVSGAYEHRVYPANNYHSQQKPARQTHTRLWSDLDPRSWPATWKFLVRFSFADDYYKNTKWS